MPKIEVSPTRVISPANTPAPESLTDLALKLEQQSHPLLKRQPHQKKQPQMPPTPLSQPQPTLHSRQQPQQRSRYIPATIRHAVWLRDHGKCTFKDPRTGEGCDSKKFLEVDHIISFAQGGESTFKNLRLLCGAHNQRHAIEVFGFDQVSRSLSVKLGI